MVKRVRGGITPKYPESLHNNMPHQLEAYIATGEGHTKY